MGDGLETVRLDRWHDADFELLRRLNAPEMTDHLGGPETEWEVFGRHQRYLSYTEPGVVEMFVVEVDGERIGTIGYWERTWRDEAVYETGWTVLPGFQGRGVATAAARALVARLRDVAGRRFLYAFPSVDHPASNAVCRKAGFTLLGETDFLYPRVPSMRVCEWRLDLDPP
ncbi:GNAT family N-acetyltransferase [Actinomadura rayongensis]|uniref:GNAT family N-acetyltransferase n=1 Tax=Actinomadura rayongensis TaxID=1429076 RepID=A0A6I4W7U7_9ACTN|nr:GNAT family N-acetyltransferase [Actinomadura rayongensis]MXQ63224.1 GNAT family N-acetyltransferase [Actinomadura rayongensis]